MPELKEATNEGDVWVYDVEADEYLIRNYTEIKEGQPWMEIPPPPSYVKLKRWTVREYFGRYFVVASNDYDTINGFGLPTREAAERIAAIYEEVMP